MRKAVSKALANLKGTTKNCYILSTNKNHQTMTLINLLQDVEVATLSTFETIPQFISGSTQTKSNTWLSISMSILQSLVFSKTSKFEELDDLRLREKKRGVGHGLSAKNGEERDDHD